MLQKGKRFYNHIEIVCITCLNILKMSIPTGIKKSLGRTLLGWEIQDNYECHSCHIFPSYFEPDMYLTTTSFGHRDITNKYCFIIYKTQWIFIPLIFNSLKTVISIVMPVWVVIMTAPVMLIQLLLITFPCQCMYFNHTKCNFHCRIFGRDLQMQ